MEEHKHHILSEKTGLKIFISLLVLTVITVAASRVDFGMFNFPIAMLIATVKALLVVFFFMGLEYDTNENRLIFATSFVFCAIFIFFTFVDIFWRGEYKVVGDPLKPVVQAGELKFKTPWEPSTELLAHGKTLYEQNCVICHGASGKGDGAAGGGMNPHPRNFTAVEGWKNGRKPSQIAHTLTVGLNQMPSFVGLAIDDRWAIAHYVTNFGPNVEKDSPADLVKAGIDTTKPDGGLGGGTPKKTIPTNFAIDRYLSGE